MEEHGRLRQLFTGDRGCIPGAIDPLKDRMVCLTKTQDGTSSHTAGSAHQEHRILPQSLPGIVQSLQERNVILWLKIYVVVDEQDCKAE